MACTPNADARNSSPVSIIDRYTDRLSIAATLVATTSKTINQLISTDTILADDAVAVIISDGTIQYDPTAATAATAASGFMPSEYWITGGQTILENATFYSAAEKTVSIIIKEVVSTK